ncbi:MAG: Fic family protein [Bacteroidales bacterium]|nr:Fic family protein [Bacteroidales bacterium]
MNYSDKKAIYIWQCIDWPNFKWEEALVSPLFNSVQERQARLLGMLSALGFDLQKQTALESMTEDVVRSSEIEGELLNRDSVRSSIARHLGVTLPSAGSSDHYTEGIVQVAVDAVKNCNMPLDKERLFNWHAALFPTGRSGMYRITVADWRQGVEPMLVVSGAMGKERVHYEAPPSSVVPREMDRFMQWFNGNQPANQLLKAAVTHLWFVAVHPFDDGNGRLTRTLTDMLIARGSGMQCYSVSAEILKSRKDYYAILERTTCGDMDITEWLLWFLQRIEAAIITSEQSLRGVLRKTEFWNSHADTEFNERQRKIINRLYDGFEGPLTSSKWAKICHCSPDTALRDITSLIEKGVLVKAPSGGRNTHYTLAD